MHYSRYELITINEKKIVQNVHEFRLHPSFLQEKI